MSDAGWREAARLLRQHVITPKQFVEALGEDGPELETLLEGLKFEIDQAIHWCRVCRKCEHDRREHDGSAYRRGCSEYIEEFESGAVGRCPCEETYYGV